MYKENLQRKSTKKIYKENLQRKSAKKMYKENVQDGNGDFIPVYCTRLYPIL